MLKVYFNSFNRQADIESRIERNNSLKVHIHRWVMDILKAECNLSPTDSDPELKYNEHGKPYLSHYSNIFFNLSHCEDVAVLAVSSQEVGIDIESRIPKNAEGIINRFFSSKEQEFINSQEDKDEAFLYVWTCKESFYKYIGCGLSQGLKKYELSFNEKRAYGSFNSQALYFHTLKKDHFRITVCSNKSSLGYIS